MMFGYCLHMCCSSALQCGSFSRIDICEGYWTEYSCIVGRIESASNSRVRREFSGFANDSSFCFSFSDFNEWFTGLLS